MNKDQINDLILKNISFSYYEKIIKKLFWIILTVKLKKVNLQALLALQAQENKLVKVNSWVN